MRIVGMIGAFAIVRPTSEREDRMSETQRLRDLIERAAERKADDGKWMGGSHGRHLNHAWISGFLACSELLLALDEALSRGWPGDYGATVMAFNEQARSELRKRLGE